MGGKNCASSITTTEKGIKMFETNLEFAQKQDQIDPLKNFRNEFYIPDKNTIYLDGNSLGRLPLKTKQIIDETTHNQWGNELIESWNKHWYEKPAQLGNKIAGLIGASENEVIVSDSTSVNLYKLVYAALKYNSTKTKVVSDVFNFPSDLYIIQGILADFGENYTLELANSNNDISINTVDLFQKIDKNTALVVLSLVSFKSSYLYNAKKITDHAHQNGALVLWDLSHATGAVEIQLNKINADLAVGCTYKYLNGGPGSPAFLFVKKELQEKLTSPIQGWFGDAQPFQFDLQYKPAKGIKKFLAGTPPIISMLATEPGIDLLLKAGIKNIQQKSKLQSEYCIFLVSHFLKKQGVLLGSPINSENRGSHVSLKHPEAYRICQALINPKNSVVKIIPDFRDPDIIRFGLTPLYTSFEEIFLTIKRLEEILSEKEFESFSTQRKKVT